MTIQQSFFYIIYTVLHFFRFLEDPSLDCVITKQNKFTNTPQLLFNTTVGIQSRNCVTKTTMLYPNKNVQII